MKYIVVHSGSRDNYQVSISLQENGSLKYLITDDYILRRNKPKSLAPFIKTSYLALLIQLLNKLLKSGKLNNLKDKVLSNLAYKYAKKNSDCILLAYSYYSANAFPKLDKKRILFQLHPHPQSIRQIFTNEINTNPVSIISLSKEHELLLPESEFQLLANEACFADNIITASSFTKKTLIENNIPAYKIHVVPYGVELSEFKEREIYQRSKNFLKVIFVGSINQRKGLSYVSEACKALEIKGLGISLTVIGRGIIDDNLVTKFELKHYNIYHNISKQDLIRHYQNADVFVFPSLCEGFGHVILEAMATGLPIITTPNTSGPDIIDESKEGFIVPIGQANVIAEKLEYLYNNPEKNNVMGKMAAIKARHYTWERFRENLRNVLKNIELGDNE